MAEPFAVNFTAGAEADLEWFNPYARRIILDGVELHLRHEPSLGTRRIKALRDNPIAGWESDWATTECFTTWTKRTGVL